jgi:hypothetical protein
MKLCRENPTLFKIGRKYRTLCMTAHLWCMLLAAMYVVQQYRERIFAFPWQRFQYLLYCWQRHMYIKHTKGAHCCVSIVTMVRQKRHIVTLHIHCLALFLYHRAFLNINYVLHQTNAHIYLKNIKIFFKILDKKPLHMFRLIDKPSSGGVTTACFNKTRTHIGPLLRSIVITVSHMFT